MSDNSAYVASGQVALVTGGNRGIGLATVRGLAFAGATVVMGARDEKAAQETVKELVDSGLAVSTVALDVTSTTSVDAAAKEVERRHGHLDILVNNAGILPEASTQTSPEFADLDALEKTFRTNVLGAVTVIETCLPLLRASRAGRVVNVSTTMGSLSDQVDKSSPYYGMVVPAYQASKAALNSITIGLSKSLADTNIKVTSVCPGFVQTDLTPVNRDQAPLTAAEGAEVVVRAAVLPHTEESGRFISAEGPVAW